MKIVSLSKQILALAMFISLPLAASSPSRFTYSSLIMKNYDEMASEVKERIAKAEKAEAEDPDAAKMELRDALRLILSRPNLDNMVSQLTPLIRTPLRNIDAYEAVAEEIVNSALQVSQDNNAPAQDRATALIVLENFLSEYRPDFKNNAKIQGLFNKIANAKIKIADSVRKEFRKQGSVRPPNSPSDLAQKIIGSKKK